MTPDCPLCHAPASYREQLSQGWQFCNGCARCYRLDVDGQIVGQPRPTNHGARVEFDTGGVDTRGES